MATAIVKRNRTIEHYDRNKLIHSIIRACLSVRVPQGEAATIAEHVRRAVESWMTNKPEVTSNDIRRKGHQALVAYQPEAAYIYKQRRLD